MSVPDFQLKHFLNEQVDIYISPTFIPNDPISIPHRYSDKHDIEIMGFFAATLAWGQRKTILQKCSELEERMNNSPYSFIMKNDPGELKRLVGFKHRTFNDTDLLYFVDFLHRHYQLYDSLEDAFLTDGLFISIENSLTQFEKKFFDHPDAPKRTRKHIATPARNSTCKRLNMFLRWMVRDDDKGVDFGLWKRIPQHALICPIDVHVDRTARQLGLITRKQTDWKTAVELTENLRCLDPDDPVKYDFALFGLSVDQKNGYKASPQFG
ncbi:MAG: hypothetical protein BWZ06_00170 [Bacteroidetes bacterium ADurb.BinA261]|jgi:uncharacterized protein (TIGR02757 family)|nr:MAG: hypothetical protein BWZ06_00170 [Bacteroidetes bacterium ADurb.BinA261]